jgi:glycine cleavage system transcriptional repressor
MQLAITLLGNADIDVIAEIILLNSTNQCRIIDLKSSTFADISCGYMLVEGNWNQLAKYESTLHAIEKKHGYKIHSTRIEKVRQLQNVTPYAIEVIGLESSELLSKVVVFFTDFQIEIEEINARRYPAPYLGAQLVSARFVIALPQNISLFQLRDELMNLCDLLNADLLFEPFKMNA